MRQTLFTVRAASFGGGAPLPANTFTAGWTDTLVGNANGALIVDGVAIAATDEILVAGEVAASNNGIYRCLIPGAVNLPYQLYRVLDLCSTIQLQGLGGLLVSTSAEGGTYGSKVFIMTTIANPILNTTPLTFQLYPPPP